MEIILSNGFSLKRDMVDKSGQSYIYSQGFLSTRISRNTRFSVSMADEIIEAMDILDNAKISIKKDDHND